MNKPIPYTGNDPFIFISYSHRNTETVLDIVGDLQKQGFRCWYDDGIEAGVSWDDYIAEHIEDSGFFMAFVSKEYSESDNCIQELRFAIETQKTILLIRLDGKRLTPGLEMRLCTYQAINVYELEPVEVLEKIISADDIEKYRPKQEVVIPRYSYKETYPKLCKVLKQSYYCEALYIENELIDNTLFWCLYNLGLIAAPTSIRIRDSIRGELTAICEKMHDDHSFSMKLSGFENKIGLLSDLIYWANNFDEADADSAFSVMKSQLKSEDSCGRIGLLNDVIAWHDSVKELTSDMIRKASCIL